MDTGKVPAGAYLKCLIGKLAADFGTIEHPPGAKTTRIRGALRVPLHASPRGSFGHNRIAQHLVTQHLRKPAPDGQARIALDATFSLLEIEWIGREIPMNRIRAPGVKIETLLTNGRCCQDMWPEWRIETPADFIGADWSGLRFAARHLDDELGLGVCLTSAPLGRIEVIA